MKRLFLMFTTLVLLTSAAFAFQGNGEPSDLPQSQYSKVATVNSNDKVDDWNANMGDDHEVHTEVDSRRSVRRRESHRRLAK